MITQIFLITLDTHNPRSEQPVRAPPPQSSFHPSYSRNPHTSGILTGDNYGNLSDRIQGSTIHNPLHFGCNMTSFVPLPCVIIGDKLKTHIPPLDLHELGNVVGDLLLRLFPGFCLYKGLHNTKLHPNYIKPPTHQPIARSTV